MADNASEQAVYVVIVLAMLSNWKFLENTKMTITRFEFIATHSYPLEPRARETVNMNLTES